MRPAVHSVAAELSGTRHTAVLTVVHCQNLPAVHLHKVAQRELSVVDPQLLGPLKRDALHTKPRQEADQLRSANRK